MGAIAEPRRNDSQTKTVGPEQQLDAIDLLLLNPSIWAVKLAHVCRSCAVVRAVTVE